MGFTPPLASGMHSEGFILGMALIFGQSQFDPSGPYGRGLPNVRFVYIYPIVVCYNQMSDSGVGRRPGGSLACTMQVSYPQVVHSLSTMICPICTKCFT